LEKYNQLNVDLVQVFQVSNRRNLVA